MVTAAGTVSSGARVSTRVIICTALAELPTLSVAIQVRVMMVGQVPLELSRYIIVGLGSRSSTAVAQPPVLAGGRLIPYSRVKSSGTVSSGGVTSVTVMVWGALDELPQASVAIHRRTMVILQQPAMAVSE
jgi:hypothetical protein